MLLRCPSTHGPHACSLTIDWRGEHAGDHRAHDRHDLSRPVVCTWPNLTPAPRSAPTPPPAASGAPRVGRRAAARHLGGNAGSGAPGPRPGAPARRSRFEYEEITEWDLLPDAD